jgi:hypothetical protein
MTGSDLIVLAPWIVFAVGLAAICFLLLRSRRASGPRPRRPSLPFPGSPADWEPASRANPQEARCPENKTETRPK